MAIDKKGIAYLTDIKLAGATQGNFAAFGSEGELVDSGKSPNSYYDKTNVDSAIEAVRNELSEDLQDVSSAEINEYALAAYKSSAWATGRSYAVGNFCLNGNIGYRCIVPHTSAATFNADSDKWSLVLSSQGKAAIDALLAPYGDHDSATLLDLASVWDEHDSYALDDLVIKDDKLQICTRAGGNGQATFSDSDVATAISRRVARHAENTNIHVTPSEKTTWNNKADGSILGPEYDTSSKGYAVGESCVHEGKFYVCTSPVAQNEDWDASKWMEFSIGELIELGDSLPIRTADGSQDAEDSSKFVFSLSDKSINIVSRTAGAGESISLIPPSRPRGRNNLARNFLVVLSIAGNEVQVSMEGVDLRDCFGSNVSLSAPIGTNAVYKFVDISSSGSVLLVTGAADPAIEAIQEIDSALDDIIQLGEQE